MVVVLRTPAFLQLPFHYATSGVLGFHIHSSMGLPPSGAIGSEFGAVAADWKIFYVTIGLLISQNWHNSS